MALASQSAGHQNWNQYSQQMTQVEPLMEATGIFYRRDSRPPTPNTMSGRLMAPPFMVTPGYNSPPIQSIPTPQYQPSTPYSPYGSPTDTASPPITFKQEFAEQTYGRFTTPDSSSGAPASYPNHDMKPSFNNGYLSPSSRRSSAASSYQIAPCPAVYSKTVSFNEVINPSDRIEFDTDIDQLMRAIQRPEEMKPQVLTPAPSPKIEEGSSLPSPVSPEPLHATKPKKYTCDGPSCNKAFTQKTHLEIHKRTHNGAKPHKCKIEGCNLTFSQRGNLRTHMRRHTGDRPFKCSKCNKAFAQRGNVRSHEKTHEGKKPYVCKLEECYKTFSQLGNMKTHQNNFHKGTLRDLTIKFMKFTAEGHIPPEYRNLFEYFKTHYKNSNKGIKGRGKARKVATIESLCTPPVKVSQLPQSAPHPQAFPQVPLYHLIGGQPHVANGFSRPTNYPSISVQNQISHASNAMYTDENTRQMMFGGRLFEDEMKYVR